jgi:hypothetical protein
MVVSEAICPRVDLCILCKLCVYCLAACSVSESICPRVGCVRITPCVFCDAYDCGASVLCHLFHDCWSLTPLVCLQISEDVLGSPTLNQLLAAYAGAHPVNNHCEYFSALHAAGLHAYYRFTRDGAAHCAPSFKNSESNVVFSGSCCVWYDLLSCSGMLWLNVIVIRTLMWWHSVRLFSPVSRHACCLRFGFAGFHMLTGTKDGQDVHQHRV